MKVKIKYHDGQKMVKRLEVGDWIDLRSLKVIELKAGELAYIPLGVSMELPRGYEAILACRSSTPAVLGVMCATGIGVIDNAYCGNDDEWHFPALAIRDTTILEGDRICQFRIVKSQPKFRLASVERLTKPNRGGIGSTGRR